MNHLDEHIILRWHGNGSICANLDAFRWRSFGSDLLIGLLGGGKDHGA
jgi:hypothetical protein